MKGNRVSSFFFLAEKRTTTKQRQGGGDAKNDSSMNRALFSNDKNDGKENALFILLTKEGREKNAGSFLAKNDGGSESNVLPII
jgi:hypothetical protein